MTSPNSTSSNGEKDASQPGSPARTVRIKIRRQDGPGKPPRWEEFDVPLRANMNIISALQWIAAHPRTVDGQDTTPVVYDSGCLEEVCGACTMLINGKTRQSCSALVEKLIPTYSRQTDQKDSAVYDPADYGSAPPLHPRAEHMPVGSITLEPLTKFPLVRDLFVDRQRLFNDLKRVKAWVPIDGTYDLGPGPKMSQELQQERYWLSRCISCGCCLEACPQYGADNHFTGAMIFTQVKLFNIHPVGAALKDERMEVMMSEGGIGDCSKAGNCVVVCPKEIPNLESIATVQRQATVHAIKKFFSK